MLGHALNSKANSMFLATFPSRSVEEAYLELRFSKASVEARPCALGVDCKSYSVLIDRVMLKII